MQRCLGCMRECAEPFGFCPHCGYAVGSAAESKNQLSPGTILQDRYLLGKALGHGGFGITYIAWDQKIGRAVAVKEYMPNAYASRVTGEKEIVCYNEEARRQFDLGLEKTRKETHALSQFGALESVVKVYDCIEENGTAYIIMELLRGRTVKEILDQRGKLTFAETMRIMTPVLQTLGAMHRVGMIHRDVAPDNIFVCGDGKVKLLDFGAARVVSATDEKTLSVMLKAGFAPVEQYSSRGKQGPYTDVYAASATIYKMLTGVTPPDSLSREMGGDDLRGVLAQSDAPPGAQAVILHGMAQYADDRIRTTQELLQSLRQSVRPQPLKASAPKKQPYALLIGVLAGALVIAVAVCAVLYFRSRSPQPSAVTAAADTTAVETTAQSGFAIDLYRPVIEAYGQARVDNMAAIGYTIDSIRYEYAIRDINGDGVEELVIHELPDEDYEDYNGLIGAIYTLDGDQPVELYFQGRHGSYQITANGYFVYYYHEVTIEKLVGAELVEIAQSDRLDLENHDSEANAFLAAHGVSNEDMEFDYILY